MQIPKEINIKTIIKRDAENFNRIYRGALDRIKKTKGIERFLLSWALIEQITLPSLIRLIFYKLSLKDLPNLEKMNTFQLISCYYFLSHDNKLYKKLVQGNALRNKIVHKIYENEDFSHLEKKLKKSTTFVLKEILIPILERLTGKKSIPVLTLYAKGWNDFRKQVLKIIDEI